MAHKGKSYQAGSIGESIPHESDEIRPFFYNALRAVTGYNYLIRSWLPREGPLFVAFIQVMRDQCYYNAQTGEVRNTCFPEVATLAGKCGVSRATIFRLLARDDEGRFINPSLGRFLKIIRRRRYDPELQREVQTSNLYLVAMDDPVVPEDDELLAEKEAEIAAIVAMEAAEEEKRKHRRKSESHFETPNTVANCDPDSSRKLRHEKSTPKEKLTLSGDIPRSTPKDTLHIAHTAIGNELQNPDLQTQAYTAWSPNKTSDSIETDPIGSERKRKISGGTPYQGVVSSEILTEREIKLIQAEEEAGGVIASILEELGDANVPTGVHIILNALVGADAPEDALVPLAYLGRDRLNRFRYRGGQVENKPGFYTNLMRNLAYEAKAASWDVERMQAKDLARHNKALEKASKNH